MQIDCNIIFAFKNKDYASIAFDSLEIDNENFLESKITDNKVCYNITSDKLGTFLSTADDLIASEIVVEKIINNSK